MFLCAAETENVEERSVIDGGSVTLNPGTGIQGDDLIMWMFGDKDRLIALIRGGTVEKYDDAAGVRFRDNLQLNKTTGSLTISGITPEHTGLYNLQIISNRETLCKKFWVFMPGK